MFNLSINNNEFIMKKFIKYFTNNSSMDDKIINQFSLNYGEIIKKDNNLLTCCRSKQPINKIKKLPNIVESLQKENKLNDMYLKFNAKNIEFFTDNICVDLFISDEFIPSCRKKQTHLLCQHAMISLINPSKKSHVYYHNDIANLIMKYIKNNAKFYLINSNLSHDIIALLVINKWTKFLIKHKNTTFINTLSYILQCNQEKISILIGILFIISHTILQLIIIIILDK